MLTTQALRKSVLIGTSTFRLKTWPLSTTEVLRAFSSDDIDAVPEDIPHKQFTEIKPYDPAVKCPGAFLLSNA